MTLSTLSLKQLQRHNLIYLATPYSAYPFGLEPAFQDACRSAATLIRAGVHLYCPIAHTHPIADVGQIDKLDHSMWLALDAKLLEVCDALVISNMEGWEGSKGIQFEANFFVRRNKPIYLGHSLHLEQYNPYLQVLNNKEVSAWLDGLERQGERENTVAVTTA